MINSSPIERFGPNFTIEQRWPKLINLEMLHTALCQASEERLKLWAAELHKRYSTLTVTTKSAKKHRDKIRRAVTDNEETITLQYEKIQELEGSRQENNDR